jgi:hypothetical protein
MVVTSFSGEPPGAGGCARMPCMDMAMELSGKMNIAIPMIVFK